MQDKMPLVSICIPTYNRADMVCKAIESALGQTYKNIEVIVVDNASCDNTEEVVKQFVDCRLKYYANDRNLGLFGNFNRCIELAQGDYIHILHSDDTIDREFTEKCMQFFSDHPTVKMTTTSARNIGDRGTHDISFSDRDWVFSAPEGLKRLLSERCFVVCPSVMVHREVYRDIGGYSLEFPYSSDFYQWFKITRKYDVGFVYGVWLNYRQGEHSESYRLLFKSPSGYIDTLKILIQIQKELNDSKNEYSNVLNKAIRRYMKDCIFAGFTRAEDMVGFKPTLLIGLALASWAMLRPTSWRDGLGKTADFLMIIGAGIIISISPLRKILQNCLLDRKDFY